MRKALLAVGVLFIYGIGSGELLACGDKFLVASRGTRYQRAGQARHGASILVYMHATSTIPKAFEKVSEDVTKKAGYRVMPYRSTTDRPADSSSSSSSCGK